jgi:TonB family protein
MNPLALTSALVVLSFVSAAQIALGQATDPELLAPLNITLSEDAIAAGIAGRLLVEAKVGADGRVKDAKVLAGPQWPCGTSPNSEIKQVREMVIESVESARFTPATKKGKPVTAEIQMMVDVERIYLEREKERAEKAGESRPRWPIIAGVLNGRVKSMPVPETPSSARAMRISGPVTVAVIVDEQGNVATAGAVRGHGALQEAARDAACSAKFAPTKLEGKPIGITGVITYVFR